MQDVLFEVDTFCLQGGPVVAAHGMLFVNELTGYTRCDSVVPGQLQVWAHDLADSYWCRQS